MKIAFVYRGPHNIHQDWADAITDVSVPFINKSLLKRFTWSHPAIHQFLSIFNKVPPADVYFVENGPALLPVILWGKKGSKIILLHSDTFFYDLDKSGFIKKKISMFFIKHVDGIISTSNYMESVAKKYTKVPQKVVYPHVDYQRFAKTGCDIKSANIGFISQVSYLKGSDILFNAFNRIRGKYQNKMYLTGLVFDGFGKLKDEDIIFNGVDMHPEKYLKHCGLYINPARNDPFGINILEAMSAGIPPIVSRYCGASEVVAKVDKRLIVNLDEEEIIQKIDWLQSDLKMKAVLGKKCKAMAANYTKQKQQKDFKKRFYELVEEIDKRK